MLGFVHTGEANLGPRSKRHCDGPEGAGVASGEENKRDEEGTDGGGDGNKDEASLDPQAEEEKTRAALEQLAKSEILTRFVLTRAFFLLMSGVVFFRRRFGDLHPRAASRLQLARRGRLWQSVQGDCHESGCVVRHMHAI